MRVNMKTRKILEDILCELEFLKWNSEELSNHIKEIEKAVKPKKEKKDAKRNTK